MIKMTKALLLFSGGLDSRLAAKLLKDQGIELECMFFILPFGGGCCNDKYCSLKFTQKELLKLQYVDCTKGKLLQEYLNLIKKPKHGHGRNLNPCIDCRVFMLKKAKKYADKNNIKIIATGEVLGERPMSQHKRALEIVETSSGLKGILLRPLSAKLLPETDAEKKGLIDREKLLDIRGRSRKPQIKLAKKYKITFPTPAGGCLLCEPEFCKRLRLIIKDKITNKDINLLKVGRYFKDKNSIIIVGRNEKENKIISKHKGILLEPKDIPGPTTLLLGKNIKLAAQLTVSHTKAKGKTKVKYDKKTIEVKPLTKKQIDKLRI
jgi:tRNA-specific 2-thiouridylase